MKNTILTILVFLTSLSVSAQWNKIYQDSNLWDITDIHFFNQDTAVITGMGMDGNGFYLRTTDGTNWTFGSSPDHIGAIQSMLFVNDTVGYSVGKDAFVKKTTNQGISWNNHSHPYTIGWDANDLTQVNDSVWLLIGDPSGMFRSQDSLKTWSYSTHINFKDYIYWKKIHAFHFMDDKTGYVIGNGIYKTIDQGLTWNLTSADTNHFYNGMYLRDSLELFAVGDSGVFLKSMNGGANWTKCFISTQHLRDITSVNDTIGFCVGGGGGTNNYDNGYILVTLDGGNSWSEQKINDRGLNSIQCFDSVCYIVGGNKIFKISNYNVLDIQNISPQIGYLKVYPNPTIGFIEIDIMDGSTLWDLKLFNITGELVLFKNKTNRSKISLESIPSGVYFLQLKSKNKFHIGKIIKN